MSTDFAALRQGLAERELPFPLPGRRDTPDEELIRGYIRAAAEINALPDMEFADYSKLSAAIREHIDTRYRDCWDEMVAAYFSAPVGIERQQYAYWLMQAAGSSKKYVDKVLDVVLEEDPDWVWEFTPWLITKINQQQWDRLAPHLTSEKLLEQHVNFIRRKQKVLEKNGVTPWIPGVEL